jgi:REP element-mobilizing transposase RayT
MQVVKQRFARELLRRLCQRSTAKQGGLWSAVLEEGHAWQRRFYDFVVWNPQKRVEKLRYRHRNPVKRRWVSAPEEWKWSSFGHYAYDEAGPVLVNGQQPVKLRWRIPPVQQ